MAGKPEDETRTWISTNLGILLQGSLGMVDLLSTSQVIGMSQNGLIASIGHLMVETPAMRFFRQFREGESGCVSHILSGDRFRLTERGRTILEGLIGLEQVGGQVILSRRAWVELLRKLNLSQDNVFHTTPQQEAVPLVSEHDMRARLNALRVRRGLQPGAPLTTRVALDIDLARRISAWSEGADLPPGELVEIQRLGNLSGITTRIKSVELYDKLKEDPQAVLDDSELLTLGKILTYGPREEFYNLDLGFVRDHPQAQGALERVARLSTPRASLNIRGRLLGGRGGGRGTPPNAPAPVAVQAVRPEPPMLPRQTAGRGQVRFTLPRANQGVPVVPEAPTQNLVIPIREEVPNRGYQPDRPARPARARRNINGTAAAENLEAPAPDPGLNLGQERAQEVHPNAEPADTEDSGVPIAVQGFDLGQEQAQEAYQNAGEVVPPEEGEELCPICQMIHFGLMAFLPCGHAVHQWCHELENCPICGADDVTTEIRDVNPGMDAATAALVANGIWGGDPVDQTNYLSRPDAPDVVLIGYAEGLDTALVLRRLEEQFPGLTEEFNNFDENNANAHARPAVEAEEEN